MDQAAKLREMARRPWLPGSKIQGPRVIAVTSGKGGVGKSNITLNLAIELAKNGKRVVILDADLGTANIEVLTGITSMHSIYDVLNGEKTLEQVVVNGPCGIKLIPGGSGLQELADFQKSQVENMYHNLEHLVQGYDFLFIDTGAGISKSVLGFVAAAQEVIVVATPEPTSLTDAYSMIKILVVYRIHPTVHVIVNRAADSSEAELIKKKIDLVTNKFLKISVKHLGCIYDDQCVPQAVRRQQPFVLEFPFSKAAKAINQVACSLTDLPGETHQNGVKRLIARLARCFG